MRKNDPSNSYSAEARKEAFRKAEASLFLSGKDPNGSPFYNEIKNKVINGELTYEEAKREVLNYHIEKSKDKKANI
ncbi:antitoxin VbhA family protein [Dickeya fangzhongdai]|uniref:antitoxin VbhA family protein n=1 Tax=Dickeya fangzhongdai TaxID=1778540 RepID=UPI002B320EE3|nr:antitoxin VbhA family protein [Dickeya fangzhongdai]